MFDPVWSDALWERLAPLIPAYVRRCRFPGRRRADERAALEEILYVLVTGIGRNCLPTAAFGASGATCWRRLDEWTIAGVWLRPYGLLLLRMNIFSYYGLT